MNHAHKSGLAAVILASLSVSGAAVAEEATAGLSRVDLVVTAPDGTEIPITTLTDNPVTLSHDDGTGVTFLAKNEGEQVLIEVVDSQDPRMVIDSQRVSRADSAIAVGYGFRVIGKRYVSSVDDLTSGGTT